MMLMPTCTTCTCSPLCMIAFHLGLSVQRGRLLAPKDPPQHQRLTVAAQQRKRKAADEAEAEPLSKAAQTGAAVCQRQPARGNGNPAAAGTKPRKKVGSVVLQGGVPAFPFRSYIPAQQVKRGRSCIIPGNGIISSCAAQACKPESMQVLKVLHNQPRQHFSSS